MSLLKEKIFEEKRCFSVKRWLLIPCIFIISSISIVGDHILVDVLGVGFVLFVFFLLLVLELDVHTSDGDKTNDDHISNSNGGPGLSSRDKGSFVGEVANISGDSSDGKVSTDERGGDDKDILVDPDSKTSTNQTTEGGKDVEDDLSDMEERSQDGTVQEDESDSTEADTDGEETGLFEFDGEGTQSQTNDKASEEEDPHNPGGTSV